MGTGHAVVLVPGIHRERAVRENDRLVHVVPQAADADFLNVLPVQFRPPVPYGGGGEVRKVAQPRPDFLRQQVALRTAAEIVAFHALPPHRVFRVDPDAGVHDQHRLDSLLLQRADHARGMRKILQIPREPLLVPHVVLVQVYGVAGDAQVPEALHQVEHGLVRVIAPFGLVVAQGPQGRQFRRAGKARVGGHNVQGTAVVDEVIIHQAAEGAEGKNRFIRRAEVKVGAARIVKQQPVGPPFPEAEKKGDAFVQGIGFLVKIVMVRSPHGEILAPQVQGAGLVPQAEEVFRVLKMFPDPYAAIPRPVLGFPAESAFIREQRLVRDNIVKIHFLLFHPDANPQQARFNDMNSRFVIFPDFCAWRHVFRTDGVTRLIFSHRAGKISHPDETLFRNPHAESYFGNDVSILPPDHRAADKGQFPFFSVVEGGAHGSKRRENKETLCPC